MLDAICQKAKTEGRLPGSDLLKLYTIFDQRLIRALEVVHTEKVTVHTFEPSGRKVWTVEGEKGEYLVFPKAKFCSCQDFYFQVVKKMKVHLCYHLIAQKMASVLNQFIKKEHPDDEYDEFLKQPVHAEPDEKQKDLKEGNQ